MGRLRWRKLGEDDSERAQNEQEGEEDTLRICPLK